MSTAKVAVTINKKTLTKLDSLVKMRVFPNRSSAIQNAVEEKLRRLEQSRLARELTKLDPQFEKRMAEEGFSGDTSEWPEY